MNATENVRASKTTVFTMGCVIIGLLVVVLILLLREAEPPEKVNGDTASDTGGVILDGENVPVRKELEDWLISRGFEALMLVRRSKVKVVGVGGRELKPCRLPKDGEDVTELGDRCGLDGIDLENLNSVVLFTFSSNPPCDGMSSAGTLITWHTSNTAQWNPGDEPCHSPH